MEGEESNDVYLLAEKDTVCVNLKVIFLGHFALVLCHYKYYLVPSDIYYSSEI